MPQPPATPPSSDITSVDRDGSKVTTRGQALNPQQQEKLAAADKDETACPIYDPEIASKGNSQ